MQNGLLDAAKSFWGRAAKHTVCSTEQTVEQCETFTDSEVLRISETRNSRHTSSNGSVKT